MADHGVPDLELVSFKLCPFVQRSVITLRHKAAPYRIRYVDLADPPAWFRTLSPRGKVPLLVVDGGQVVFESAVINEFIDEVTPGRLHPDDPLQRALNRSWIEFGSAALMDLRELTTVATADDFAAVADAHLAKLTQVEVAIADGPFFNGASFSLVDAAYAPLLMRLDLIGRLVPLSDIAALPKIARWRAVLLDLPAVAGSVVADFADLFEDLIARRQGYLATRLPDRGPADPAAKSLY
jgi:glutathione S-transferase